MSIIDKHDVCIFLMNDNDFLEAASVSSFREGYGDARLRESVGYFPVGSNSLPEEIKEDLHIQPWVVISFDIKSPIMYLSSTLELQCRLQEFEKSKDKILYYKMQNFQKFCHDQDFKEVSVVIL